MEVKERTYEEIVLANPGRKLEMYDGEIREKPTMTVAHNRVQMRLVRQLTRQLDFNRYDIRVDNSRVHRPERTYFIPDVFVVEVPGTETIVGTPRSLEIFERPCLLIAEVWSDSTGEYDITEKIPEYRVRGDREIWRLHPYDLTLYAWRREPSGLYTPSTHQGGSVELAAIPGVVIDLVDLFA